MKISFEIEIADALYQELKRYCETCWRTESTVIQQALSEWLICFGHDVVEPDLTEEEFRLGGVKHILHHTLKVLDEKGIHPVTSPDSGFGKANTPPTIPLGATSS